MTLDFNVLDFNVLYEDEFILAVDKPAGLLMHPSWLDRQETDTLVSRVKQYFLRQGHQGKVHTVHRLDRPTSGLVLIAKDEQSAKHLSNQFLESKVQKSYWAICRGFCEEAFVVDKALIEEKDKIGDKYASAEQVPQQAVTEFKRLGIAELALPVSRYQKSRFSLLECRPQTGRKHQIRRHLKHVRHPILSDSRYGCRHHNKLAGQRLGVDSLALRAVAIVFIHPHTGQTMKIDVPLDAKWKGFLSSFGWSSLAGIE